MDWNKRATSVLVLWTLSVAGCATPATSEIPGPPLDRAPMATLNVPPKKAVWEIEQAIAQPPLSLTLDSANDGVIVTGWKEYEGAIHIVRRWPERTRFYIVVNPDFNDPGRKCRVLIYDQTQEKADERQGWVDNSQLYRKKRSDEVLQAIERNVASTQPAEK